MLVQILGTFLLLVRVGKTKQTAQIHKKQYILSAIRYPEKRKRVSGHIVSFKHVPGTISMDIDKNKHVLNEQINTRKMIFISGQFGGILRRTRKTLVTWGYDSEHSDA